MRPQDNPFNTRRVEALRVRLPDSSPSDLLQRLDQLGGRAAIAGPEGSGKTSLLVQLEQYLVDAGARPFMIFLNRQNRRPPWNELTTLADDQPVLLDGSEQLGPLAWKRFQRCTGRSRRLIVTQHAPGRLPCLIEMKPTRSLLAELVAELTGAPPPPDLNELFDLHKGNIRDIFRELYDRWAECA